MPAWLSAIMDLPVAAVLLRIGLVVVLAYLGHHALRLLSRHLERRLADARTDRDGLERLKTLIGVSRGIAVGLLLIVAALMILQTLGVNVVPLLAGAGVVGLAISLGAQTLVKDFIGGLLILVEGQFSVGDTVRVGEQQGEVERITLRATFLRDVEGRLHILPNGEIRAVSNLTVGWSRAVVDLNVPYEADMNAVLHALEAAVTEAAHDPAIANDLLEPPRVIGWSALSDWAVQVRLMAKTQPGRQWSTAATLRREALRGLEAAGMGLAVPRQKVELQTSGAREGT